MGYSVTNNIWYVNNEGPMEGLIPALEQALQDIADIKTKKARVPW